MDTVTGSTDIRVSDARMGGRPRGSPRRHKMSCDFGLMPREWRALRALRTPVGIQRALEAMPYHVASSAWSPRRVLREGTAHCLEGAIFAAAALRVLGLAPLLLDLEAVQDTDHVVSVFKLRGHWGAIATSNFSGLLFLEPVYGSVVGVGGVRPSGGSSTTSSRGTQTVIDSSRQTIAQPIDRRRSSTSACRRSVWRRSGLRSTSCKRRLLSRRSTMTVTSALSANSCCRYS